MKILERVAKLRRIIGQLSHKHWHDCQNEGYTGPRGEVHCNFEGTTVCTVCQLADEREKVKRFQEMLEAERRTNDDRTPEKLQAMRIMCKTLYGNGFREAKKRAVGIIRMADGTAVGVSAANVIRSINAMRPRKL